MGISIDRDICQSVKKYIDILADMSVTLDIQVIRCDNFIKCGNVIRCVTLWIILDMSVSSLSITSIASMDVIQHQIYLIFE